jgi:hypothetical protein
MACEINASPSNGLVQSADGSGVIKLKSNGKTTNALAWVNFNGTGTVAIRSSYNVSSITDNGVGNYTVNFATALSDANYSLVASATQSFWSTACGVTAGQTTTAAVLRVSGETAYRDASVISVAVFGN